LSDSPDPKMQEGEYHGNIIKKPVSPVKEKRSFP
jgi:hypothetical protein